MAFTAITIKMDQNIELMSKVIHFLLAKLTIVGVELPALGLAAINYFIYDLGDESYVLPFPMM